MKICAHKNRIAMSAPHLRKISACPISRLKLICYTAIKYKSMIDANESLNGNNGTGCYYKYNFGMVITDGCKLLCETFSCWWFLDVVCSYQPRLRNEAFQCWSLGKNEDSSAIVICTDGNNRVIVSQEIPWTDFKPDCATLWVEGNSVILLPSEH